MLSCFLSVLSVLAAGAAFCAQVPDSLSVGKEKQNESAFINAASDSKPREISLGLPTNVIGSVPIFEDGLPVSCNILSMYPYKSWHGGVSASSSSNIGPMETAMRYNEIGYFIYGINKTGIGSKFGADLSYTFGMYGQHKIDFNLHGPISKNGWYYSLSMYQNFDPGSNHLAFSKYKDRHQFYKGLVSKELAGGKGFFSFAVQYVSYYSVNENFGPFIFNGDGSVSLYDGFDLGHDQYLPSDRTVTYMDAKTGNMVTKDLVDDNRDKLLSAAFNLSYDFNPQIHLDFRSRYKHAGSSNFSRTVSAINNVTARAGYTYADGTPYSGNVQNRNMMNLTAYEHTWFNNAELSVKGASITVKAGWDLMLSGRGAYTSSAVCAHEVCADPQMLYLDGQAYYNFNSNSEYYDGTELKSALYGSYDWRISGNWRSEGFVRVGLLHTDGTVYNSTDDIDNKRHPGFNFADAQAIPLKRTVPEWSAGVNVRYYFTSRFSINAESIMTSAQNTISDFLSVLPAPLTPYNTLLARGGISYEARNLNITSQITYISQNNKQNMQYFTHVLTKDVGGRKAGSIEALRLPMLYGISSLGLVTDANWTVGGGFILHSQLMLRNPKYRNFQFNPTFSDGVAEEYDFSGKFITAMPRIEFTLDPSYSIKSWRIWLTARYLSKEYINKTNTLFFSGRIETFGGVDYTLNRHVKFNLNIINLFNQKGVSGSIQAADLIEDVSGFSNYLMCGKFIRPFTIELGVKITL